MKSILLLAAISFSPIGAFAADCAINKSEMRRQNYVHDTGNMYYEFSLITSAQDCSFKLAYPLDDIFADNVKGGKKAPANPVDEDQDPSEWGSLKISLNLPPTSAFVRGLKVLFSAEGMTVAPFKLDHNSIRKCYAAFTKLFEQKAKPEVLAAQQQLCVNDIAKQIAALAPAVATTQPTVAPIEEAAPTLSEEVEKALTCSEGMETYHTCNYVKGNNTVDTYRLCLKDGNFGELRLVDTYAKGTKVRNLDIAEFSKVEETTNGDFKDGKLVKYKEVQFKTPKILVSEEGNVKNFSFKQFGVMNKKDKNSADKSYSHELSAEQWSRTERLDPETNTTSGASAHASVGGVESTGYFKCN